MERKQLLLYAVTDRAWSNRTEALLQQAEAVLANGATCLQLREKSMERDAVRKEAESMAALCRRYHVPFIIDDDVDIAMACGADGVHVGQEDMSVAEVRRKAGASMIIGATAHTVEEAMEAERQGADYLGLGAVFATHTKADATPLSYETLKEICAAVSIPAVAIGGITEKNVTRLAGSGISGIAVVSALFGAPDPGAAAKRMLALAREVCV